MSLALELNGVIKRYRKRTALDGLSMKVPQGCVMGLVGSNGAGKTTALAAVAGLIRLQGGSINILGAGSFNSRVHAGRLSLLPQDSQMPGHLRVDQFLCYLGRLQGIARENIAREADAMLDWVNLADRKRSKIASLSHGMRRRVTIAQAFLGSPDLVLLDEPLNGLDPKEVVNIRNLIRRKRPDQTLIVSSHLLNEVESGCDEIAFIEQGKCIRQDRLEQITSSHETVKVLLDACEPAMDQLKDTLPMDTLDWDAENRVLTATSGGGSVRDLNARLLKVLLDAGLPVLEVRRGHGLENEYLRKNRPTQ